MNFVKQTSWASIWKGKVALHHTPVPEEVFFNEMMARTSAVINNGLKCILALFIPVKIRVFFVYFTY
jgi:hypothetical protein